MLTRGASSRTSRQNGGGWHAPDQNKSAIERKAGMKCCRSRPQQYGAPDKWKTRYNLRLAIGYRGTRAGSDPIGISGVSGRPSDGPLLRDGKQGINTQRR